MLLHSDGSGKHKIFTSGFLQPVIFQQVGSMTYDIYTNRIYRPISSQQKIKRLGKLVLKLATSTSNGKYQLLIQCSKLHTCLGG